MKKKSAGSVAIMLLVIIYLSDTSCNLYYLFCIP